MLARRVRGLRQHRRGGDRPAHVVVRRHDQLLGVARVVRPLAVAVESVRREHGPLDERAGHEIVDVVGQLPAQPPRADLLCAPERRRRRDPRALGRELRARAESDDQPAAVGGVGDRDVAERRARLARVDEPLQRRALDVVGDGLAVEDADRERVGAAVGRRTRRCGDAHAAGEHTGEMAASAAGRAAGTGAVVAQPTI